MSAATCPDERYNRLFIVANHSEVIYPTQQRDIPPNMTVATLTLQTMPSCIVRWPQVVQQPQI